MQTGWVIYRHLAYFSTSNVPLDRDNYPCTEVNGSGIPISAYGNKQAAKVWSGVDIYGETVPGSTHTYNELYDIVSRYDVDTVGQSSPIQVGGITVAEYRGQDTDLCPATKTLGLSSPFTAFSSTGSSQTRTVTSLLGQVSQNWSASLLTEATYAQLTTSGTGSGATLTVTCSANSLESSRNVTLRLTQTTTGETRDYTILQEAFIPILVAYNRTQDGGTAWAKNSSEYYNCTIFDPTYSGNAGTTGVLSIAQGDSWGSGDYSISGESNCIFENQLSNNDYISVTDYILRVKKSCTLRVNIPETISHTPSFWDWNTEPANVHSKVRVNSLQLQVSIPSLSISVLHNLQIANQINEWDTTKLDILSQSIDVSIDRESIPLGTDVECRVDLLLNWECIAINGYPIGSGDVFHIHLDSQKIELQVKPL